MPVTTVMVEAKKTKNTVKFEDEVLRAIYVPNEVLEKIGSPSKIRVTIEEAD